MPKIIHEGGFIVAHHNDYILIRDNENYVEISKNQLLQILQALLLEKTKETWNDGIAQGPHDVYSKGTPAARKEKS
jgi:hypothetical protein